MNPFMEFIRDTFERTAAQIAGASAPNIEGLSTQVPGGFNQNLPDRHESTADYTRMDPTALHDNFERLDPFMRNMRGNMTHNQDFHQNDFLPGGSVASNINARNRQDTLRLSRLADAMNNQYFKTMELPAAMAAGLGGLQGVDGVQGQVFQMGIQTEEQRQMERMRLYEQQMRQRMIQRQQRGLDIHTIEQDEARMRHMLRQAGRMTDEEIDRLILSQRIQHDFEQQTQNARFARAQEVFTRNFNALYIPGRQARMIMSFVGRNNELAQLLSGLFSAGVAPDRQQYLWGRAMGRDVERMQREGRSDEEIYLHINRRTLQMLGELTEYQIRTLQEVVPGVLETFGSALRGR
jgi:hypothetical protein